MSIKKPDFTLDGLTASARWQKNRSSGFTLVETLIAITIVTLSVAGPLYTASRALVAAEIARDQLTASYLAQEGIEYIRFVRDNAYLALNQSGDDTTQSWANFLTAISQCHATASNMALACAFDPVGVSGTPSLASCTAGSCPTLYLADNGTTNYYTTSSSSGTKASFSRSIQVIDIAGSSNTEKQVISTVSWSFHGTTYTVSVTDHLSPWQ